jgi:type VI secretion system secreted protein Hcp
MKRKYVVASIVLVVLCLADLKPTRAQGPSAQVRTFFYVTVKGVKQGQFKGDVGGMGPTKDQIMGIKFSMQETSPRDLATGLPSGKRQYSPITFTKLWGPSSLQFLAALSTNEQLLTVTFQFSSITAQGKEAVTEKITLTNATVSSIRRYINVPTGNEAPDPRELEDISFTFQRIEYQDNVTGAMATDDWTARM